VNILLLLIPLGLGLLAIAVGFFVWAVRNGQLENLDHEGTRILFDDDRPPARRGAPDRDPDVEPRGEPDSPDEPERP
jgi:cbb3-type cytochrome oxidase maturation protein